MSALSWTLDKLYTLKQLLLSVTGCSGFVTAPLLLSVVGSTRCIHLLATLICLLCEISSARSRHGGLDAVEKTPAVNGFLCPIGVCLLELLSRFQQDFRSTDGIIAGWTLLLCQTDS